MNAWWTNNWDKVSTLFLGGVVGFFSGILATNQEISELKEGLDNFSVCTCMLRLCYARKKVF